MFFIVVRFAAFVITLMRIVSYPEFGSVLVTLDGLPESNLGADSVDSLIYALPSMLMLGPLLPLV
jgi:hypothetical protein